MLHNPQGRIYPWRTCLLVSYKNCLLKYKLMSYPFRVQCDRRGPVGEWRSGPGGKEWAGGKGVGQGERSGPGRSSWPGGRSGPGRIGLLYVIYAHFQDFLFDFLIPFQETEPLYFRSSSITDHKLRDILVIHSRLLMFLINTIFLCLSFFLHWQNFEIRTEKWPLREEVHGLLTQISPTKW